MLVVAMMFTLIMILFLRLFAINMVIGSLHMFIRHDVKSKNDEKPKRERFGPEVSSVNQLTF